MSEIPTDWLDHSARLHPARVALADSREQLTYAELRSRAGGVAGALAEAGVGPGDPVAIDLPAGTGHAIALHGAILAGAVVQSMPTGGRAGVDVAAGTSFVDQGTLERAERLSGTWPAIRRASGAPLTRVLTSGTTGEPKPVHLTGANHLWSALASGLNLGVQPEDRWLCCLPLNHVGGLTILLRSAVYGTAAIIHDGFDTDRVAGVLSSSGASIVSLVATQLVRLLDAEAALKRPRLILVGGGPVPADVLAEALERGAPVVQTYGLTEACSQVCTLAPSEARTHAGSAGKPLLGIEVRIDGGEILVRGPNVAPTALAADGWLHTSDVGRVDEENYLWVEGRVAELIVSGGENVRPARVEAALREDPDVADVAVAGREDREWGEVVIAYVVAAPGHAPDAERLLARARRTLDRHEVPKRIELVEQLPRTPSGKLQRRLLPPDPGR